MFNAINFIKERRKLITKKRKHDKRIFLYMLVLFSVVLVLSMVLLGFNLFLSKKVEKTISDQNKLKQILNQGRSAQLQHKLSIIKLKLVAKLFSERKNKQAALNYFSNLFDPSVRISSINYDESKKTLSFTLFIPSVFKLEEVLDRLDSAEVKQQFGDLNRGNITRASDGSYSVSVKLTLKGGDNQ